MHSLETSLITCLTSTVSQWYGMKGTNKLMNRNYLFCIIVCVAISLQWAPRQKVVLGDKHSSAEYS